MAAITVVAATWAGSAARTEYTQPLLQALGARPGAVSTLLTGATLVTMAGVRLAEARPHARRAVFVLIPWLLAAGALLRAGAAPGSGPGSAMEPKGLSPAVVLAVAGLALHRLAGRASQVIFNALLLETAPAHLRGTVLSAGNTLWAALSLAAFPLLGYVGGRWGLDALFALLAGLHAMAGVTAARLVPVRLPAPRPRS
ncbi:hypothetical protein [Thermaerobacter marianensis]|uniref:hypothetical protein n=1 Tax=Thermaerobacter marianensis TaxID=73919 RepID=UPI000311F6B0|nr:hypothetical protein [Thermaerobacter marianensis]